MLARAMALNVYGHCVQEHAKCVHNVLITKDALLDTR